MINIIGAVLRGFLLLCGAVVLGLSVTLAKHQQVGAVPSQTGFSSFAGAFGIIASAIGLVALFMESFPALVALVADSLAAVFYLAGGVALAVAMKGVSCTGSDDMDDFNRALNGLLNSGCVDGNGNGVCSIAPGVDATRAELKGRCQRVQADYAFEFIACAFGLGAIALAFLSSKRSGRAVYA